MSNSDISPDDIKSYVAVGPAGYGVTITKRTFDLSFIIFTLVFGAILITVIALTIHFANINSRLPPSPPPLTPVTQLTIHTNLGAAAHSASIINVKDATELTTQQKCEQMSNTMWTGTECQCKPPFFGNLCSREKHDSDYYAVGIPNESTLGMTVIDEIMSDGKSFKNNSCSDYCNKTSGCNAFIYHPFNMCTLLTDNVIVPFGTGISYSSELDATLYMKSSINLQFEGRILLGEYPFSLPPRYWLVHKSEGYTQLIHRTITSINFIPTFVKNYGSYTGIYCTHEFTNTDVDIIINRGENSECYVHHPGVKINLPTDWKYKLPLYVVYF